MYRLDVDIELLELNWISIPNQTSIGNGLQYQIRCLDVDGITIWNLGTGQYRITVWMYISWNSIDSRLPNRDSG